MSNANRLGRMANEGSRLQGNDDYQDTDAHGKSRNVCIEKIEK